ncbi:ral guanine nucleotide dissociation stimulator-like 1 [Heterodontus francisci]|uniref:ral guanine nucleotide dissociation stimulator-like 1 n=1 Tax=Heterodontus francisci TaxID=7792 RepID=UPI00355C412A
MLESIIKDVIIRHLENNDMIGQNHHELMKGKFRHPEIECNTVPQEPVSNINHKAQVILDSEVISSSRSLWTATCHDIQSAMAKQERDQGMETVPAPGPSQESRGVPTNPETEETRQRTRSGAPLQVIPVWTLTPPPLRQTPSNSIQDWVEEIEEGASYNVILKEERIQQTPNKSARWQGPILFPVIWGVNQIIYFTNSPDYFMWITEPYFQRFTLSLFCLEVYVSSMGPVAWEKMSLYEKIVLTETEADCKCTKKYKTDYSRVKEQAAGINMCTIIGQLPTGTTSRRQPEYGIDSPFNQVEGDQVPPGHTSSQATKKIRAIKAGTLQQLVNNLLTASGDGDSNYTRIFLSTYRAFASPEAVLDLLLDRYRECDWEENDEQRSPETRNAITSVLRAWLDLCSEDFCEVPNYTCLQKLLEHLRQTMPGSDLEKRAHQLLEQFQQQDLAAQELDNSYHGKIMFNRGEEGDAKVEEVEDKQDIFSFPSGLVAEQLTYMDAELFKKVVIHHCLGCIWSQRHKKQNQHLATTIRATITQFNNITKCVISSILKDRNLKPDQRARLLEKWITIAEKSRTINNYSSLRAIVAALQSSPIYKLRKTWAAVSNERQILDVLAGLPETLWCTSNNWLIARSLSSFCSRMSSMGLFEELEEQCCHRINYHLGEEDVMQGTVPYLGTFLTDLTMLDTALPDYVGDLINFEKKRREFEVIAQIKLLKSACNNYCITPVPKFLRWFNNQQYLTDEESYNVSREIEAAPESSPSSPKDRKSLVKCLSLLFHGTEVAERTPSKSSDQPKSPRIGSSGENMDSSSEVSSHSPIRPVDTVSSGVSSSLSSVSSSSSSSRLQLDSEAFC